MAAPAALPFSFSQVPGSPSFRSSAVNTVALIPLLSSDKDGEIATTNSAQSFRDLFDGLRRHSKSANGEDLLLVIPNSSLTRPGDWRYNDTPLKAFHWQHGCQRLHLFDGRPENSRLAHDRLMNHAVTRDWIDVTPSRRTAAVIGIVNIHDCKDLADLHRAEEELHQWAERFATPPYEVTAHGRSFDRDKPVERLFVFDSFDEECQKIDLSKSSMGNSILAFPPAGEAHSQMMDLHLNVVVNDLAVAIFQALENKIRESEEVSNVSSQSSQPAERRYLSRIISAASDKDGDEPAQSSNRLSLSNLASLVSPESKLAQDSPTTKANALPNLAESTSKAISSHGAKGGTPSKPTPQLLTPMDDIWDHSELAPRDAEAFRKREVGRREKFAADLSLLAGSPIDAYERYLKAAELCKTGIPDPLWYAAALEGCAAAHICMAEAGGHSVDEYLENNFQLPEQMMALVKKDPKEEKSRQAATSTKQTLPEVVFALCEEAMNIFNRHAKLSPFHAELLLKLAWYSSESSESHLRCRWGEGAGCYAGEPGGTPRWEKTSISQLQFGDLKTQGGEDMIGFSTFNRIKKVCELLQRAVSLGALDPATRVDVAARSARMCLEGVKATQWKKTDSSRIELPRKAAFFAAVAAEAVSTAERDGTTHLASELWLLACQLYSGPANLSSHKGSYGWATLRASTLHALSLQGNTLLSQEAAELVLSLLGELSPEANKDVIKADSKPSKETDNEDTDALGGRLHRSDVGPSDLPSTRPRFEDAEDLVSTAMSSAFATKLRDSFSTMTAASSVLAVQSKWADDEVIKPVDVPLAEPSELSTSVLALSCVWSQVDYEECSAAQKNCITRMLALRRAVPASSLEDRTSLINDSVSTMPLYISSAMAIQVDSTLELELVKLIKSPVKVKEGAMATFYNPFDNKGKSDKVAATRVAEEEERAMLVQFGNRLSVPLEVQRCELTFENNDTSRVKATALAFVIPPKSTGFTVHFPFTVLSRLSADKESDRSGNGVFEVKGMNLTCLGRSFFLPIHSSTTQPRPASGSLPAPASNYPHMSTKTKADVLQEAKPFIEFSPCQPLLRVFNAKSGAPLEAGAVVSVNLSDGEIFTIPALRLENYAGPSGRGKIERLLISANGLSGKSDLVLYDSDSAMAFGADESEEEFFHELVDKEKPQPLKLRARVHSLTLASMNQENESDAGEGTVKFQIAAAHNMGTQIPAGTSVRIRFRYRGLSNEVSEVWRTREIILRVVPVKGPHISSMAFRPDLVTKSAFGALRKCVVMHSPTSDGDDTEEMTHGLDTGLAKDETFVSNRVGLDSGMFVCREEVVFLLSISNNTSSEITLSRPSGAVGGFEGCQLSTVLVHAGVSATIPVVVPRMPRVDETGAPFDIVSDLVSKTSLLWETKREDESGEVVAKGRIRIPPVCLKDLVHRHPSFVPSICQSPLIMRLHVGGKADESSVLVSLGAPLEVSIEVELAPWLSEQIVENCTVTLELCCVRQSGDSSSKTGQSRDFVWCGKQQQKINLKDPKKAHSARIAFVREGQFVISACARISRTDVKHAAEEIWFAPAATTIMVDNKSSSPSQ